jgi:hypothetical protein
MLTRNDARGPLLLLFVALFMSAAPLLHGQAAKVTGTVAVDKTKITPQSVSAVSYKAPNGALISVLFSDKPPDAKEFQQLTRVGPGEPLVAGLVEGAWKGFHIEKRLSGFSFTITSDRRIMSNEFLIGGRNNTFSVSDDELILELTSTAPRLAGRVRTKAAVLELGGHKTSLDVSFDVPVVAIGK